MYNNESVVAERIENSSGYVNINYLLVGAINILNNSTKSLTAPFRLSFLNKVIYTLI